jgi:hypothetical protein
MAALCQWNDVRGGPSLLAVLALDTGHRLYRFVRPAVRPFNFQWAPDGKAIDYVQTKDGIGNIGEQQLAGGPPKQRTHFASEEVMHFDWSPDGTQLLVARGPSRRRVFLLSNFRQVVRRRAPSPATERAKAFKPLIIITSGEKTNYRLSFFARKGLG